MTRDEYVACLERVLDALERLHGTEQGREHDTLMPSNALELLVEAVKAAWADQPVEAPTRANPSVAVQSMPVRARNDPDISGGPHAPRQGRWAGSTVLRGSPEVQPAHPGDVRIDYSAIRGTNWLDLPPVGASPYHEPVPPRPELARPEGVLVMPNPRVPHDRVYFIQTTTNSTEAPDAEPT